MLDKIRGIRLSIRVKLVALFLVVAMVPLTLATVVAQRNATSALLEMGRTNQEARAQNTTRVIDEYNTAHLSDVSATAALAEIREAAQRPADSTRLERGRTVLTNMQKKDSAYESMALLLQDGSTLISSVKEEEGSNAGGRPAFQSALFGKPTISDAFISPTTGRPALELMAPVRVENGNIAGVVRAQMNFSGIVKRITDDAKIFGRGSSAMLVDEYGIRLAMSDAAMNFAKADGGLQFTGIKPIPEETQRKMVSERNMGQQAVADMLADPQPEIARAMEGGKQGSAEVKVGGTTQEMSFATMATKPWSYIVTTPRAIFTASADKTTEQLTKVGLATAAATAIVAFLFSMTMTRPIVKLARTADAVSMGDTDAVVEVRSNDEIGDLASSFSRMMASVRFYMTSFHDGEEDESTPTAA